jgi:hypothetical protein
MHKLKRKRKRISQRRMMMEKSVQLQPDRIRLKDIIIY